MWQIRERLAGLSGHPWNSFEIQSAINLMIDKSTAKRLEGEGGHLISGRRYVQQSAISPKKGDSILVTLCRHHSTPNLDNLAPLIGCPTPGKTPPAPGGEWSLFSLGWGTQDCSSAAQRSAAQRSAAPSTAHSASAKTAHGHTSGHTDCGCGCGLAAPLVVVIINPQQGSRGGCRCSVAI